MELKILKKKASNTPKAVALLQKMYGSTHIPICILNQWFQVIWHNKAMERVCPDILAPDRIVSDTTIPLKWIKNYIKDGKPFCDCFQPDSVFVPFGFVFGKIPAKEPYYFMQARDALDSGTWRNPAGLERAVNAFESTMRKALSSIWQGLESKGSPNLENIQYGADNLYRTMLMTNDYTRLLGGLYPSHSLCIDLRPFLHQLFCCAGQLIDTMEMGIEFDFGFSGESRKIKTQPILLATILCHLLSNAVRHGAKKNRIYVETYISETELQVSIINKGNGIPAEQMRHIYEPYKSYVLEEADIFSGYGLGLTIAQAGAVFLGGSLNGFSHGKQTVFRLIIPLKLWILSQPNVENELPGYPDMRSFVKIIMADCLL